MKMKVTLNSSCLVQPSQPTWTGCMALTEFDQTGTLAHTTTIYFYRPCSSWLEDDAIITTLETSLSKVLIHFYPLAGRLRQLDGARLELDCNAHGALVIEASCEAKLDEYVPSHDLYHYLYPQINYLATPIEEIPVFSMQLTKFQCSGITISFTTSHVICDGLSYQHFLSEWARVARGEPLRAPPFLDRKVLRAGELGPRKPPRFHHVEFDPMPLLIGQSNNEGERTKETRIAWLKMSKTQVETLKNEANYNKGQTRGARYTRYEAIAGHIWRCMCRARGNMPEQPTTLGICVDIRKRMDPPLPPNYYGNGIMDVVAQSCSGDVIKKPLSYAARRIREAVDRVTSEYVHSAIDYLKNMKDISRLQDIHYGSTANQVGPFNGNPNLIVTSWTSLDELYGLDFGWGKEFLMGPAPQDYSDGESVIIRCYGEGEGEGSLVIFICLQAAYMPDFITFFYQNVQKSNL